ncbi:hypothetical protein BDK51DRAFT_29450 [Blyttiomyces helicus]|uniref:Uncharacterized protein n=1 Tax=Blyttiomyces helicus TaxID=388810 RepID=A0A4P9WLB1_9FUNG|nr:hypothetical protein BDK51DRAFT_29450 [Blyttiomyces helicus]|eukprot:RKO92388.1 hypothetical protein BDK51DRAFT_29450 [Blyttiomyces helicus]
MIPATSTQPHSLKTRHRTPIRTYIQVPVNSYSDLYLDSDPDTYSASYSYSYSYSYSVLYSYSDSHLYSDLCLDSHLYSHTHSYSQSDPLTNLKLDPTKLGRLVPNPETNLKRAHIYPRHQVGGIITTLAPDLDKSLNVVATLNHSVINQRTFA